MTDQSKTKGKKEDVLSKLKKEEDKAKVQIVSIFVNS
jgi:hypothetical protein